MYHLTNFVLGKAQIMKPAKQFSSLVPPSYKQISSRISYSMDTMDYFQG
jgi:hypothetical protein